ncbi:MAG: PASTA domain-containing protein, partial [Oscillospiraceae bacterium]|nr:PASTA domain-containing protein [Oscillospiraceae bacterium]
RGPGSEIMPNVVGRDVAQVRQELEALGFVVDIGTPVANDNPDRTNTVEHVSLTEGQPHLRGSRVLLRVWGEVG